MWDIIYCDFFTAFFGSLSVELCEIPYLVSRPPSRPVTILSMFLISDLGLEAAAESPGLVEDVWLLAGLRLGGVMVLILSEVGAVWEEGEGGGDPGATLGVGNTV